MESSGMVLCITNFCISWFIGVEIVGGSKFWQSYSWMVPLKSTSAVYVLKKRELYVGNWAALWRKRLDACLPPLGYRVRVSVPPCGFMWWTKRGLGRFFTGFLPFSPTTNLIPPFLHPHLIYFVTFHRPCDGASGVVARYPCYSRTYNMGASSHLIPRPDLVLDTSWGYLFNGDY